MKLVAMLQRLSIGISYGDIPISVSNSCSISRDDLSSTFFEWSFLHVFFYGWRYFRSFGEFSGSLSCLDFVQPLNGCPGFLSGTHHALWRRRILIFRVCFSAHSGQQKCSVCLFCIFQRLTPSLFGPSVGPYTWWGSSGD